jgi:hypothetical protein
LYKESHFWENLNQHSIFSNSIIDSARKDATKIQLTDTLRTPHIEDYLTGRSIFDNRPSIMKEKSTIAESTFEVSKLFPNYVPGKSRVDSILEEAPVTVSLVDELTNLHLYDSTLLGSSKNKHVKRVSMAHHEPSIQSSILAEVAAKAKPEIKRKMRVSTQSPRTRKT